MPDPIRQRYDADALLRQMPGGILHWGNTMFLIATLVLLAIAWFVRYPQTIQAAFSLPVSTQPEVIVAPEDGHITRLLYADSSFVHSGDTLALIEHCNTAGALQTYPVVCGQEGILSIYLPLQIREKVQKKQPLFVVTQEKSAPSTVMAYLPASAIGYIHPGQEALLHFDAYAPETYGSVRADVQNIGKTAVDNHFAVRLSLPEGLATNRHISIDPAFGISGRAEIVINNPRLIEKIIQPLQMLLNKQQKTAKTDSSKPLYTQKGD